MSVSSGTLSPPPLSKVYPENASSAAAVATLPTNTKYTLFSGVNYISLFSSFTSCCRRLNTAVPGNRSFLDRHRLCTRERNCNGIIESQFKVSIQSDTLLTSCTSRERNLIVLVVSSAHVIGSSSLASSATTSGCKDNRDVHAQSVPLISQVGGDSLQSIKFN